MRRLSDSNLNCHGGLIALRRTAPGSCLNIWACNQITPHGQGFVEHFSQTLSFVSE